MTTILILVSVLFLGSMTLARHFYTLVLQARRKTSVTQAKARRILADHIKFANHLAKVSVGRPTFGAGPQHMRIVVVNRFFYHANELGITAVEMEEILNDIDPIVIRDVVETLEHDHSALMDETATPWAAVAKKHARVMSKLCHKPAELLAWKRSLPTEPIIPDA